MITREEGLWIVEEWARMVGTSRRVAVSNAGTIRFNILLISLVPVVGAGCLKQPGGGLLIVMTLRLFRDDNVCIAFFND
ncbi:hypothetical protein B9J09_02195 [Xylella fastidiosa subsp. pauca]|nr:hypothetical protein B9J09_02195 [Xylella fastidiosa subsp. pauca]AVI21651.1 hypothetical protein BCV75_02065 [Xylella fastidiosa]AVI23691.1 hypothetical protein BC375_02085 [Xylella fastidiosa]KIA59356.1 hypothetical protein RA12_02085 [Xylella fastidiosa]KXB12843.1 hypothetical protein ADT32_02485 [Xylella fastidiosa]